jgi:hypothetical protein
VPGQERVGLVAASPRVRLAREGGCALGQQALGGTSIGIDIVGCVVVTGTGCGCLPLRQDRGDRLIRQALATELLAQSPRAARPGSIPTLDPGARKGLVVEVTQLREPLDGLVAQRTLVASSDEMPARLLDGAGAPSQVRGCCLHDRVRVGHGGTLRAPRRGRLAATGRCARGSAHLLRLFDALHGHVDLGDLGPDLRLKLLGDVLVRAQEILGLLPPLAQACLPVGEPGTRLGHDI